LAADTRSEDTSRVKSRPNPEAGFYSVTAYDNASGHFQTGGVAVNYGDNLSTWREIRAGIGSELDANGRWVATNAGFSDNSDASYDVGHVDIVE